MSARLGAFATSLAAAAVAVFTWRAVLGFELFGWDAYPMILAGRVHGPGGVLATFGEELMDGRYPLGHFWRPVVHLSFALDHALFGLAPFGYHLSDLLLLAANAGLVAWLAERLFGGRRFPIAGLVAGLAFALHPLHWEVLPVAPRRADALAVLFTLAALCLVAGPRGGRLGRRVLSGLACALALASKETGVFALVALALCALCCPAEGDRGESTRVRLSRALRLVWPAALAVALALALRTTVLGGLGGGQGSSLVSGLVRPQVFAAAYARAIFLSESIWSLDPKDPLPAFAALGLALALALAVFLRGGARLRAGAVLLVAWVVLLLPLTGMSALAQGWYAYPYLAPFALGAGLLSAAGQRALERGRRAVGSAALALGLALALGGLPGTPWLGGAADFERAGELQREFLGRLDRALLDTPPGRSASVADCPTRVQAVTRKADGRLAYFVGSDTALDASPFGNAAEYEQGRLIYLVAGYSLEAYADLLLGEGRARVALRGGPPSAREAGPEMVDVLVLPRPMGFVP